MSGLQSLITKSHPIHIRNDDSKKRKKALPPPPLEFKPKAKDKTKEAANDKGKEGAKQKDAAAEKGKAKAAAAAPAKQRQVLNVPIHQPQLQPPPPPPPKPQPSLPAASSWASAARQPVPAAAAAKPKAAAANGPVRAVSIWSSDHPDSQPPPPPPKKVTMLVGGELAEPEGPPKIGKAQKKNLKRLEKKALQRAATDTSVASSDIVSDFYPETISEADNEVDTPSETRAGEGMSHHLQSNDSREEDSGEGCSGSDGFEPQASDHQRCIQALMATKARWLLGQLQLLGFPDWQCAVAVLRHGSNLHDGVAFLLEDHVTSEEQSRAYMACAVDSPDIDISEELHMLAEAQSCLGLPMSVMERAVADTDGDIQAAVDALMGQPDVSKAAGLHLSHSEGPSHPQSHSSEAASQSDTKQRRSSADTTKYSSIPFHSSQPTPAEHSTGSPSAWGGHPSQAPPHLPNGNHAGPYPWSAQQQQQQQQQREVTGPPLSYASWHKQAADPSPFAAAALQPPPPPPKHAPLSPPLPRTVELPATLEPHLQLDLGAFVPAGSAGLLSTKLGQLYMDPSSAGFMQASQQQQQLPQHPEHGDLPLGSRLSSYTSAASRSATPKAAAADCSSWNGSMDSSASYAATQALAAQGLGQAMPSLSSFSMFSGASGPPAARGADMWGSSGGSSQMANLERYNQLLQQSPGPGSGRSSLDSSQAPFPGIVAAAQRQAYLPSLSPGTTVSQASAYAGSHPVQPQAAAWGMLPMHSSAQLGSDAPEAALLAAAAVAADVEPRRGDGGGRDTSDADLELDSLMATLMCT
ncbi:hypothetical protein COCSUDRAFT_83699 [Coccomyxa subellipsoidea C-169]|uniref:UBA domain-containing protein n=1 Tax=Coccomyxa subellipsoidea (strain C-169) TaxID=574566 RepID=I0YZK5_COCSC|nr:hypothetical protein COCSUDRAFT_83699 [Coccomyxa subellipsoidea C-169]EIE23824.1 hypothetical protein COCSUDRAFT_83699 [Coccomyxa subellipsoidea C-169]|eukprot:XP_005648368.1 hypothetical protein COCSUDRAFT_83699 [Coccomyxa subellipsoidea C-169]